MGNEMQIEKATQTDTPYTCEKCIHNHAYREMLNDFQKKCTSLPIQIVPIIPTKTRSL